MTQTDQQESLERPGGLRKIVAASMAGTVVEWYEFFLYGIAATVVFNKIFFKAGASEYDAIIAAFVTYAVGFIARPLGGIVFGHFGDRLGRKSMLVITLTATGGTDWAREKSASSSGRSRPPRMWPVAAGRVRNIPNSVARE